MSKHLIHEPVSIGDVTAVEVVQRGLVRLVVIAEQCTEVSVAWLGTSLARQVTEAI